MARLNNLCKCDLSASDFQRYPVWVWNDEETAKCPLDDIAPDPAEHSTMFVRASFSASSHRFDGYLIGGRSFYAFALFVTDKRLIFNLNLPDMMEKELLELHELVGTPFPLFPISYESDVRYVGGERIRGQLVP